MRFQTRRTKFALLILFIVLAGSLAQASEPLVIARLDLNRQADFESFNNLNRLPFFRIGNVFFAELDQRELSAVRRADIPFEVVDDQPFSGRYYFGTTESIVSKKIPATDMERLAEVGDHALYKSAQPIDLAEFRLFGFEPIEVKKREIPLTYFRTGSTSLNPHAATFDPILSALVAVVDQDSVYAYNTRLEDFQTRLTFSDSNLAARDWIKEKFESFGYTDVFLDEFWCDDNRYGLSGFTYNIVCVKEGTAEPDKVIVIGGHWDSIIYDGGDPYVYAPGSDDNGSGTAATLEIARVLAGTPTKKTIIFVAFGAEESGLWGSWYFAYNAAVSGMDIQLMINMDMIGYTEDDYPNIECSYLSASRPYSELMAQMALEYTWLIPEVYPAGGGSDHWPFDQNGFNVANTIESDFNFPGWHTQLDLTSRMDFPYETEVTRMCLATLYTASDYPSAMTDAIARDVGDGQSLQVEWTALSDPDIVGYWVYWGTASESYFDSTFVPGGSTSQTTISGLAENQPYYLTMIAVDVGDRESFLRPEFTGTPRVIPLPPSGVVAETEEWRVELFWEPNQELDFDFYRIYRAAEPGAYSLLADNLTSPAYIDNDVAAGTMYDYVITAVDVDQNESEYSEMATAAAATFDQGILIVDQTRVGAGNPTTEEKEAFFAAVFSGIETSYYFYDPLVEELSKSIIGQYEAVFWFDDDNAAGYWLPGDLDKLRWYLSYNTNVVLAGWRMAFEFADLGVPKTIGPGNLLYDFTGVNHIDEVTDKDFVGAVGDVGIPNVAIDPDKVFPSWNGKMGWIGVLGLDDLNDAAYTFDSHSGVHTGKIVAAGRDNGTSKFVFLSMPFYYLMEDDAAELISVIVDWFGFGPTCDCSGIGDCSDDGIINPVDVVYMINYALLMTGPPPPTDPDCPAINRGDFNCDGRIDLVDVVLLINYVYRQPAPGPCDPCIS